jgi:hypothetical protein
MELLDRGDPLFIRELRRFTDADQLGSFAARWFEDPRPASRQFLLAYLDLPLNAFRHEPLVKRLFKLAEKADDDEVMGRFLVLFDRSLRRVHEKRRRSQEQQVPDSETGRQLGERWKMEGFSVFYRSGWNVSIDPRRLPTIDYVRRSWLVDAFVTPPNTSMMRPHGQRSHGTYCVDEARRQRMMRRRLFSVPTRRYLCRRAWRYFRQLGKRQPDRYVPAIAAALTRYQGEDVANGLAMIDNWGLMHVLFHHSTVLRASRRAWGVAPGRALGELTPAPIYEALWQAAPHTLLDLLTMAGCRPVRQWAAFMLRRDHGILLRQMPLDELMKLLAHDDPAVVALAVDVARELPDVTVLGLDRLLALMETPHPETLELVCDLLAARLGPEQVSFEQAVRLTASRPLPAARLGFTWLQAKTLAGPGDCQALLGLAEAQAEPLRPDLVRWVRGRLSDSPHFQPAWVLEFLDSRHAEVRAEGWHWLQADVRARDNVDLWQKLLESPYDDMRLLLLADLEKRAAGPDFPLAEAGGLDDDLLRLLWASVLLNVHRGGRVKPIAVGQIVRRLLSRPAEARSLLPILAVALRSLRGPEWRSGMAGVVQLVDRRPSLRPIVEELIPELQCEVEGRKQG